MRVVNKKTEGFKSIRLDNFEGYPKFKANTMFARYGFEFCEDSNAEYEKLRTVKDGDEFSHVSVRGLEHGQNIRHFSFDDFQEVANDLNDINYAVFVFCKQLCENDGFKKLNSIDSEFGHNRHKTIDTFLNGKQRVCEITGETVWTWRLGGFNTYRETENGLESMAGRVISRKITNSMNRCRNNDCGKYVIDLDGEYCSECRKNSR